MKTIACLVVLCAPAIAAPKPPLCAPPQEQPATLFAGAGEVTVCWGDKGDCMQLGKTDKDRKAVPRPASVKPTTEVRDDGGKLSVCTGAMCKPVGKKLAAAVAAARKEAAALPPEARADATIALSATSDLALVALNLGAAETRDRVQVWSVAKDKRLTARPPAEWKKSKEQGMAMVADAVGATMLVTWIACAGPCAQGLIVDANGANQGAAFPGGRGLDLDGTRIAIVPDNAAGRITIVDGKTGKHVGDLALGDGMSAIVRSGSTKLAGGDFAALYDDGSTVKVSRISAPAGKPATIVWTQSIEACP